MVWVACRVTGPAVGNRVRLLLPALAWLMSCGHAWSADADCLQLGGKAVCVAPRPADWTYDFCWNTGVDTVRWSATKCQAMGGSYQGQYATPPCIGWTPNTEENLPYRAEATAPAQLQATGCSCAITRDSGWGLNSDAYWCYPGPPEVVGGLLVKDKRHLDHVCTCPDGARVTGSELVRWRYPPAPSCPEGTMLRSVPGLPWGACVVVPDDMCRKEGNPVLPATGTKIQSEVDGRFESLPLERHYSSRGSYHHYRAAENTLSFDLNWRDGFDYRLEVVPDSSYTVAALSSPNGTLQFFRADGSPMLSVAGVSNARYQAATGGGVVTLSDRVLAFDGAGRLIVMQLLEGRRFVLRYADGGVDGELGRRAVDAEGVQLLTPVPAGHLIDVTSDNGRVLRFERMSDGRIARIVDASIGIPIAYGYSPSNQLIAMRNIDGTTRRYLYGEADLVSGVARPFALTGILATGSTGAEVRVATFGYDVAGRAVLSEHPGGANSTRLSYGPAGLASVTDAIGSERRMTFSTAPGVGKLLSATQPAGAGCVASAQSQTYDPAGNIASRDDFNGSRVCFAHDPLRNLESSRIEGLLSGQACGPLLADGASLPSGARKISTRWHPTLPLAIQRAEPGRMSYWIYNGQPDPFAGGAAASCATAGATLPDGQQLPLLCRKVERGTTDADGASGFSAGADPRTSDSVERWTYDGAGRPLLRDGPRTDVADLTVKSYYGSGSSQFSIGDLATVVNAAGHLTRYTRYTQSGKPLEVVDARGVVMTYAYDLRQRLTSATVAGETTSYGYDPIGQLIRVTRPDGSYLAFEYDSAQRLLAVIDEQGNRVDYGLDRAGHRIYESVKDPGGVLRREVSRVFDALGRVQQLSGHE